MSGAIGQSDLREGYKEAQIGPKSFEIPEEWDVKTIPDLCNLDTESFDASSHNEDTFEYIDIESVSRGTIDRSKTIPVEEAPSRAKQIVGAGDTLVGKVRPYLQAFAPVTEEHGGKVCSTGFAVLSAKDGVSSPYITQAVLSKYFVDQMTNRMTGTSYPAVNKSDFQNVRLFAPPLPEQHRIADILSTVDEQIQQTDDIIVETKKLKKAVLQDFYQSPEVGAITPEKPRNEPDEWEARRIKDVCQIGGGSTPKKSNESFWNGTVPWVSPKEFDEQGIIRDTQDHVTEEGINDSSLTVYPEETTMVTVRSNAIKRRLPIAKTTTEATINQDIKALVPNEDEILPEYLFQILKYNSERIRNTCRKSGTTIDSIDTGFLRSYRIMAPSLSIQRQIVDVLTTLDKKVEQEDKHKQKLQELKRGLMQDLLTGKVRVNTDN